MTTQIESLIKYWALKKGIPFDMLKRQVIKESNGNPNAVGDKGKSRGLMQLHQNGAVKALNADFNKLFDPNYNLDVGTNYILKIKKDMAHLLPSNQLEAWSLVFMAYNSGNYTKKALERLKTKGITQPTLAKTIAEMNAKDFGRKPIMAVTVPYALYVAKGIKAGISDLAKVMVEKPQVSVPLVLSAGLLVLMALRMNKKASA